MNGSLNASQPTVKKNKNGHFNFVDLILILLAVALVGTLVYVFSPVSLIKNLANRNTKSIQYEVEFTNVDEDFIYNIKNEEPVGDAVSKNSLGIVTNVDYNAKYIEYRFEKVNSTNESGTEDNTPQYLPTPIEYPDKYNVIVTITADATYTEGQGYSVNSTRIAVGEKLDLKFPNFKGEGYCIGITIY